MFLILYFIYLYFISTLKLQYKIKYKLGVTCYDAPTGMRCGHCPRGYVGDGRSCKPGHVCADRPCFS